MLTQQVHVRSRVVQGTRMPSARHVACAVSANILANGQPAPAIRLIATDVDGTLLNSKQQLSTGVEHAIKAAAKLGVPMVVATGKARGPWVNDVFPRLPKPMPGVFLQGCVVCDSQGHVLWQRTMELDTVQACLDLADQHGVTITAYCGTRILAASLDEHTERLKFYHEPEVEAVGHLRDVMHDVPIQKLIFMATQPKIDEIRPHVEAALQGRASITTALTGMLEVLPLGASKGAGLTWLLEHMGVDPAHVLAMGDGENDVEMLQLAGVGVAMGNAGPKARAVADAVVASNDEDGVAEAIDRFVLQPNGASLLTAAATVSLS